MPGRKIRQKWRWLDKLWYGAAGVGSAAAWDILGVAFLREVLQRQSDGVVTAQSQGATAVRLLLAALEIRMVLS